MQRFSQFLLIFVMQEKTASRSFPCEKFYSDPAGLVQDKTTEDAAKAVVNFRDNTLNKSSSFAVLDSGFKVMLDPYNDVLRHVPLNDIAGLCARTEQEQEAWFSPAGFNRGQIRVWSNLTLTQDKHKETNLHRNGINPVVSFPGEGNRSLW